MVNVLIPPQVPLVDPKTGMISREWYFFFTTVFSSTNGVITSVSATTPVVSSGGTAPIISMPVATSLSAGYLSASDWTSFNSKIGIARTISTTAPLVGGGDLSSNRTLSITQSSTSVDGYLSSTDWNTFNNKAPINSPAFTGVPTAPTATVDTTTTQLATTAYVKSQIIDAPPGPSSSFSVFAGNLTTAGTVDGDSSTSRFTSPSVMCSDPSGNLYIADNYTIRKIDTSGTVTTLAGSAGTAGEVDGTGTSARIGLVNGIVYNPDGNIYFVQGSFSSPTSYAVRKMTTAGVVTSLGTAASEGSMYGHGLAVNTAGEMFVTSSSYGNVYSVTTTGTKTLFATLPNAPIKHIHCDTAGNLLVFSVAGVYRITPAASISLYKSSPTNNPAGTTIDEYASLYYNAASTIEKIAATEGNPVTTFVSGYSSYILVSDLGDMYAIKGYAVYKAPLLTNKLAENKWNKDIPNGYPSLDSTGRVPEYQLNPHVNSLTATAPITVSSATGDVTVALSNTAVTAASYGSASQVPNYTVDAKGRLTAASNTSIQIAESQVTNLTSDLALKAPLASPTLTGVPAAPTAAVDTNTTQLATTAYVVGQGYLKSPTIVNNAVLLTNGAGAPSFANSLSEGFSFVLPGTSNLLIDGSTTKRTMTGGIVQILHAPSVPNSRGLTITTNANNQYPTYSAVINYAATGVPAVGEATLIDCTVDTANSSGGHIHGINVSKVGSGLASVYALGVDPGVNVIHHESGVPVTPTASFAFNGTTYTTVTTGTSIFSAKDDYLYIGNSSVFYDIGVSLSTLSSKSIFTGSTTFQFWNGTGWVAFNPIDSTNGFQANGGISSMTSALSGWVTSTVNSVNAYWVRVQRTRTTIVTTPVVSSLVVTNPIDYYWDDAGNITAKTISVSTPLGVASGGTGQTTAGAGFNALSPMTTLGDTIYGGASGAGTRLAGDTSNTRKFLRTLSSGGVSAAPAWDTILAADVPTLNQNTTGTSGGLTGTPAITVGAVTATTGTFSDLIRIKSTSAKATTGTSSPAIFSSNDSNITQLEVAARIGGNTTQSLRWTGFQSFEEGYGAQPLVLQDLGGNVLIGSTTDHAGEKLQVGGAGYFSGAVSMGALTATTGSFSGAIKTSNGNGIYVSNVAGTGAAVLMYADASNNAYLDASQNTSLNLQVGTGTKLSISNTGAATFNSSVSMGALTANADIRAVSQTGLQGRIDTIVTDASADVAFRMYRWNGGAASYPVYLLNTSGTFAIQTGSAAAIGSESMTTQFSIAPGGAASFGSNSVSMGALTATTGTFTGLLKHRVGTSTQPSIRLDTGSNWNELQFWKDDSSVNNRWAVSMNVPGGALGNDLIFSGYDASGTKTGVMVLGGTTAGGASFAGAVAPGSYTLATLPTVVTGAIIYVSDANTNAGAICYGLTTWRDSATHATVV